MAGKIMPLEQTLLLGLSILAYVAQAMTAALAAGRRSMDWMGVCLLGSIAALGGGSVRDVLLGHYPLVWVKEPWLLLLTARGCRERHRAGAHHPSSAHARSSCSMRSASWSSPSPAARWRCR